MRTVIRRPYFRRVAWLQVAALAAGILLVPPVAAAPGTVLPRVAVVQVTDSSGSTVANLAGRSAVALAAKFHETGRFEVIGLDQVTTAAGELGFELPLPAGSERRLGQLAEALHADFLVLADLTGAEVDTAQQLALIASTARVYDKLAEGFLAEADISAFGLRRSAVEAVLIDDALDQNALETVKQLGMQLNIRGRVLSAPLEDMIRVNLAQPANVRLGAILALLRNGRLIARMVVQSASAGHIEGRLTERVRPELQVAVNDEAVLYRQGTGRLLADDNDIDPLKEDLTPAERGRRSNATLWAIVGGVAAVALGVWAFSSSSNDREDARTPRLIAPTDEATLRVNALNQLVTPVDFVATATKGTDTVTFQIATDAGFTELVVSQSEFGDEGGGGGGGGEGGTPTETVTRFIFSPTDDAAFLAPGRYFWRVITGSGRDIYRSQTFEFTIAGNGPGGGGGFLASPAQVSALSGDGSVEIQWTPVNGAEQYRVMRRILTPRAAGMARTRTFRPGGGSNAWVRSLNGRRSLRTDRRGLSPRTSRQTSSLAGFSLVAEVDATSLSYTDDGVENGVEYQWVVLTEDVAGVVTPLADAEDGSFAVSTPLSTSAPVAPTNLAAIPGDGQVILTWSQNDETDLAGYQVFRATSANGNFVDITNNLVTDDGSPAEQSLSAGPGDISVTDRGLTNGVTAFYRIRAVQLQVVINDLPRGGLTSPLSDAVEATPSSAPPQELQVVQPPNGSTVDADRPELAWRGVESAVVYTVQISTDATFPAAGLIQTTSSETELIYPSNLPELTEDQTYYMRVGVFDEALQQLRFGPTSTFTRGAVSRTTTTILTTLDGDAYNGARLSVDGAETAELTPAELILAPKAGNAPYALLAEFTDNNGVRFRGTTNYRPGIDPAEVTIALAVIGTAPVAPTGLKASGETDRIVLRWNPDPNLEEAPPQPANIAVTYSIRRRANTEEGAFTEIAQVPAPTVRGAVEELLFTDYNVQPGVRYFYRIVALTDDGVDSIPSVTANGVAGVAVLQVLAPQENQSFGARFFDDGKAWDSTIDFAWNPAADATRYIFEVGVDPELDDLLENGNEIIEASEAPAATYTIGERAPQGFIFAGPVRVIELYWRAIAVDAENRIINQTEARRFFVITRELVAAPAP